MDAALAEPSPGLTSIISDNIYVFAIGILLGLCVLTRITTGIDAKYEVRDNAEVLSPRPPPMVPYWIPFIGHTITFITQFDGFLQRVANSIPNGMFALRIAGGTHNVVVSPGLTRELFFKPNVPIDMDDLIWRVLGLVFDDRGVFKARSDRNYDEVANMHKVLYGMMRESFLGVAVPRTVQAVENQSFNIISGNSSWVDHAPWERAAKVEIVSTAAETGGFVAEANLHVLLRDFVGDIACRVLMGDAFIDNNPRFLDDLWMFDSKVSLLTTGLPWWLIYGGPPAIMARRRLLEAVREHHVALSETLDGKDPGNRYSELGDVNSIIRDRLVLFKEAGLDEHSYACGNLIVVWAMNVNANHIIFWMVYYLFSQPELLQQIRSEISPYAQKRKTETSGLPIAEAPKLDLDVNGLLYKCPLFKGTFLETLRLQNAPISYRTIQKDFTITESQDDADRAGKSRPETYALRKGDYLFVPSGVQFMSPRYYDDPTRFDPKRFWVTKTDHETGETQVSAEYGNLWAWGGGKTMCKGRSFAEREVLAFVAGIIMMWDIEPVGNAGWKHPGNVTTTGVYRPKTDIRVKMWRRKW